MQNLQVLLAILALTTVSTSSTAADKKSSRHKKGQVPVEESGHQTATPVTDADLGERYVKRAKIVQADLSAFLDAMRAGDPQYLMLEHNVLSALSISKMLADEIEALPKATGLELAGRVAKIEHYAMTVDFLQKLGKAYATELKKAGKNAFRDRLSPLIRKDDEQNKESVVSMQGEQAWDLLKPFVKGGRTLPGYLNLDSAKESDIKIIEKLDELNARAFSSVTLPMTPVVEITSQMITPDKTALESTVKNVATGQEFKIKTYANAEQESEPKGGRAALEAISDLRNSTASKIPPRIEAVSAEKNYFFMDLSGEGLPFGEGDRDEMRATNLHQFMQKIRLQ
jgi:hypothetical protein